METKTTMSSKLRKHNIELTNMPFVETHRHTYEFHSEISHQRDPCNIEEFLFRVRINGKKWVRVFRQMMCSVEFPETVHVVHDAVTPVEPEVQDDAVETDFNRNPFPV